MPTVSDQPNPNTLLLAEYDSLRREIEQRIKETSEYLRYGLLATGASWAWLLSQPLGTAARGAYILPLILGLALFAHTVAERDNIQRIAEYLARIEKHFALPDGFGWESRRHRPGYHRTFANWNNFLWVMIALVNLFFAGYVYIQDHAQAGLK